MEPLSRSDLARFRQRFRNHVHNQILMLFLDLQQERALSQKAIAERLGVHPSRINRLLTDPANMTLDTISDLLLAMNALMQCDVEAFDQSLTDVTLPDPKRQLAQAMPGESRRSAKKAHA